jgi:hypothetical protein
MELLVCGLLTNRNGTEEIVERVSFDGDGNGVSHTARLLQRHFVLRVGALTLTGACNGAAAAPTMNLASADGGDAVASSAPAGCVPSDVVPWEDWRGNYYHDNTGGVDGCVPRGTFLCRVRRLDSSGEEPVAATVWSFVGSEQSHTGASPIAVLVVPVTGDTRAPVGLGGECRYAAESNAFAVTDVIVEARGVIATRYAGKWVETGESNKFCGTFTRDVHGRGGAVAEQSGTFFFIASEVREE